MQSKMKKGPKFKDGMYLLPNLFTSMNLFLGFLAIIKTLKGYATNNPKFYAAAAFYIIVATFFDTLDGRIARLTKTTTKFGLEYDSLADLATFGIAPALLMYSWGLKSFGEAGWLASFLFFACVALRLARFNVHCSTLEKESFQGLPSPAGAGVIAGIVWVYPMLKVSTAYEMLYILFLPYLLAFLMVSSIRYRNFKTVDFKKRLPLPVLFLIVAFIIIIAYRPKFTIFLIFMLYGASGIIEEFFLFIFRKRAVPKEMPRAIPPEG